LSINYPFETAGLKIRCPDYTTLSKRGSHLGLDSLLRDNNPYTNDPKASNQQLGHQTAFLALKQRVSKLNETKLSNINKTTGIKPGE
jgi:hypothetical protein